MTRRNIAGGVVVSGTFFTTLFIFAVAGAALALLIGAITSLVVFRLTSTTGVPAVVIRTQRAFILSRVASGVYITLQFAHIGAVWVNRPQPAARGTAVNPAAGSTTIPRIRYKTDRCKLCHITNPSLEREGGG